jgi:hypothetical protein
LFLLSFSYLAEHLSQPERLFEIPGRTPVGILLLSVGRRRIGFA